MSTLFDIFGSHEETTSRDGLPFKPSLPVKDALPGKQGIKNKTLLSAKGKRILGDVGNKIHATRVTDSAQKAKAENTIPCKLNEKASYKKEEATTSKKTPEIIPKTPVSDITQAEELPQPETQGPSFWNENEYLGPCKRPTKESYMRKAKFWEVNLMAPVSLDFPLTPWSDAMDEPAMFDVPSSPLHDVPLEAPEVEFPWD